MAQEIERKYLVSGEAWREATPIRYRQGYLSRTSDCTVRVRTVEEADQTLGFLTIKGFATGITRAEFEYQIPLNDARFMLATLCQGAIIEKTRRKIQYDGLTWEIDEFFGDNAGLVFAEVEIASESQAIQLPPWIGAEITHLPRYFNANLSTHPYSQWTEEEKSSPAQ